MCFGKRVVLELLHPASAPQVRTQTPSAEHREICTLDQPNRSFERVCYGYIEKRYAVAVTLRGLLRLLHECHKSVLPGAHAILGGSGPTGCQSCAAWIRIAMQIAA